MIVIGVDTHKRSHTVAAVEDATGRLTGHETVRANRRSFDDLLCWGRRATENGRVWAIEDCRHVSGALERFLLGRGERVVRVPPRLTATWRAGTRARGKSDQLDAIAIAKAAISEGLDQLPVARLAGPELDLRRLVDHRDRLVGQRTALMNDLRWTLHDLWPELEIPPRALKTGCWQQRIGDRLRRAERTVQTRVARDELRRIRDLSRTISEIERDITTLVDTIAPQLLQETGCGPLTAAKLLGEIAGIDRFSSDAKLARAAGVAPLPASSGNRTRHRLDRGGNRQLNCALHRYAVARGRLDPETAAFLQRKQAEGKTRREALRILKRHLARRVWRLLQPPPSTREQTMIPVVIACGTPGNVTVRLT